MAEVISHAELRARLGKSKNTVYRLLKCDPPLPSIVLPAGGRIFIWEEVFEWLRSFETTPTKKRGRPTKTEQMRRGGAA